MLERLKVLKLKISKFTNECYLSIKIQIRSIRQINFFKF